MYKLYIFSKHNNRYYTVIYINIQIIYQKLLLIKYLNLLYLIDSNFKMQTYFFYTYLKKFKKKIIKVKNTSITIFYQFIHFNIID